MLKLLTLIALLFTTPAFAESVYDRVMKRGTIECGYFVEAPFTIRDEATGEFSGIAVELTELIARELNLKVEWKEQISFATFPQDLHNNKYDMVCGGLFVLPRAGISDYTDAFSYVSMIGYVKADDTSFDKNFSDVDWENKTIAGLDGEGATTAAQKLLPQAKMNTLPQLSNISEMLLTVATGKSDIGFVLPSVFENFNKVHPGKLKKAELERPLYTYDVGFGIARNQYEFKTLINNALRQYIVSGELAALYKKYDPNNHFDYPVVSKR